MKKENILIVVFLILVIVGGIFVFSSIGGNNTDNTNNTENKVNVVENKIENVVETQNTVENSVVEDNNTEVKNEVGAVVQDNLITSPDKNAYESNSNIGTTNQKQEAINLVKQYWGEDESVNFTCDSVTSKGEYIIAVISKETATVKGYFKVNLETKTVEVDY